MLASKWSRLVEQSKSSWIGRLVLRFEKLQDDLADGYKGALAWALDHRKTILAVSGGLLVISLSFVPLGLIGTEFMTDSDRGEFAVNIDLPLGTTIGKTDSTVKAVERIVAAMPEVERYLSTIGKQQSQWKNADQSNLGQVQVKLTDKRKRSRSTQAVMMAIKEQTADIPGLKTSFIRSACGVANRIARCSRIIEETLNGLRCF